MKVLAAVLAVSALVFTASSCAKHDWEETKVLHEGASGGHGGHGHDDESHDKGAAEAKEAHGEVHTAKPGEGAHAPAAAPKH